MNADGPKADVSSTREEYRALGNGFPGPEAPPIRCGRFCASMAG